MTSAVLQSDAVGVAPALRVMALHALAYCERLFYLEEVEELRVADEAVFAGREMHLELDEPGDVTTLTLESEALGIRGRLDALRTRGGATYPVEHKRGRSRRERDGKAAAWESDALQASAYAMLLEEHMGAPVVEVRIRYHKDSVTVRVPLDATARANVVASIARARELAGSADRSPITKEEGKCARCSLAPVCLPEEGRFAEAMQGDGEAVDAARPVRLYPADTERRSLHVVAHGSRVGRSGGRLEVTDRDGAKSGVGVREVSDVVLHGHAQITTQALRMCAAEDIPVHWVTSSGAYVGGFAAGCGGVQRRIRQYRGLAADTLAIGVARRIVMAKIEMQLRHLLRATRGDPERRADAEKDVDVMRGCLRRAARGVSRDGLMGEEGAAARARIFRRSRVWWRPT